MILIITKSFEPTIQLFCSYLIDRNIKFLRINFDQIIDPNSDFLIKYNIDNSGSFYINNELEDITKLVVWKYDESSIWTYFNLNFSSKVELLYYKSAEWISILNYIINLYSNRLMLGYFKSEICKLELAYLCKINNLLTPSIYLTNDYNDICNFSEGYIIKPCSKAFVSHNNKSFVQEMSKKFFRNNQDVKNKFPFLVQSKVNPKFEYRIFFFNGFLVCGKLMRKNHFIDSRDSEFMKYERCELAPSFMEKIKHLVLSLDLNSASIDVLEDFDENLFVIDINPTGNFTGLLNDCHVSIYSLFDNYFN